ncbi:MAG TPA: STAS/SEC14 domain-containing protein [Bacteroidia bacterium]|nr:STAS/SEC14 domain-containing protein [Bacteroidia bacterium]
MEKLSTAIVDYWLTGEGILYKKVIENAHMDVEALEKSDNEVQQQTGNEKRFLLIDARTHFTITEEAMEYMRKDVAGHSKAIAIVTNKIAVRLMVDYVLKIARIPIPLKAFSDDQKAIKWLLSLKKQNVKMATA